MLPPHRFSRLMVMMMVARFGNVDGPNEPTTGERTDSSGAALGSEKYVEGAAGGRVAAVYYVVFGGGP